MNIKKLLPVMCFLLPSMAFAAGNPFLPPSQRAIDLKSAFENEKKENVEDEKKYGMYTQEDIDNSVYLGKINGLDIYSHNIKKIYFSVDAG